MKKFTCPICGGQLHIKTVNGPTVCEACGRVTALDAADTKTYREAYDQAERAIRRGTADGYEEAIRELNRIAFIDEAADRIADCEKRIAEWNLQKDKKREFARISDSRDTKLGIAVLIVTVLLCAAAIAGVIWLVVLITQDALSPTALTVIIALVALAVLSVIFGGFRR